MDEDNGINPIRDFSNIPKYENVVLEAKRILLNAEHSYSATSLANRKKPNKIRRLTEIDLDVPNPKNKKKLKPKYEIPKFDSIPFKLMQKPKKKSDKTLMKQYFCKWKNIVWSKKRVAASEECRRYSKVKLDKFIEKIKSKNEILEPKPKQCNKENSKTIRKEVYTEQYTHRFKAQNTIIQKQKEKLEEQSKVIKDLELGILKKDLHESMINTKVNIHELFSSGKINVHKSAPLLLPTTEREKMMVNSLRAPKIQQEMNERALKRQQRHQETKLRKEKIAEEREKMLHDMALTKKMQDEEERMKILEDMKEKRRRELEMDRIRKLNKAKLMVKWQLAENFHTNKVIKRVFNKFKEEYMVSKEKMARAVDFHKKKIERKVFFVWCNFVEDKYKYKYSMADTLYHYKLLKMCFNCWHQECVATKHKLQTAEDWNSFQVQLRNLLAWAKYTCAQNRIMEEKMKHADVHYKKKLLFQYYYQWRSLPAVVLLEKAKEMKKEKWRAKVLEIIPDYEPPNKF